jgi:hypothetical protein
MLLAPAGLRDRHRPLPLPLAPFAAAVLPTQDEAEEAALSSLATPSTRAGLTAATAGSDGILPPTRSQEVATEVDAVADAAVNASAATSPSHTPLTGYRVFFGHSFCPWQFFPTYGSSLLSLCKYHAFIPYFIYV